MIRLRWIQGLKRLIADCPAYREYYASLPLNAQLFHITAAGTWSRKRHKKRDNRWNQMSAA
jgi:hypothetical protein